MLPGRPIGAAGVVTEAGEHTGSYDIRGPDHRIPMLTAA